MRTQSTALNRERLAREAFWGLMPVLADEIGWKMGSTCSTNDWCSGTDAAPCNLWGVHPATGATLAQYIQVVSVMTDDELEQIVAVYSGRS